MNVIPVIDVRFGVVVRAVEGDRANYRPLVTPLAASADPLAVSAGLMALHSFPVIYIADLDGIEGRERNIEVIKALAAAHPKISFWVDNGANTVSVISQLTALGDVKAVVGSETGLSLDEARRLSAVFGPRLVLSLDFRADVFVGNRALLEAPDSWPADVIVMTLAQVGSNRGPDLARLSDIKRSAKTRTRIYAAGGVRDGCDLAALSARGIHGALVATALHAQTITADDLGKVTGRRSQ